MLTAVLVLIPFVLILAFIQDIGQERMRPVLAARPVFAIMTGRSAMFIVFPAVIAASIILLAVTKILRPFRIRFTGWLTAILTIPVRFMVRILIALIILVCLLIFLHILLLAI